MRGLLVVNPHATTTSPRVTDVLVQALSRELDLEVTVTTHKGHGIEIGNRARIEGLDIVVTGALADGTLVCADRNVVELRESAPLQLRANAVGTMNVELGVTSFASFDVEVPDAIKITSGLV